MIKIIYGEKGSGKTKQIIEEANLAARNSNGCVVYIDKNNDRMMDLVHQVRLINAAEYGINNPNSFIPFIKGMLAANSDIDTLFIDGMAKITNTDINSMQEIYDNMEIIHKLYGVSFVITVSAKQEALPPFIKKYIS